MSDMKAIVHIMAAIRASEDKPCFDLALVDEKAVKVDAKTRDLLAVKLLKAGYIEGLNVVDDIDNQTAPYVAWSHSRPSVTLAGLEYMQENSAFRKAAEEIKQDALAVASQVVSNVIISKL